MRSFGGEKPGVKGFIRREEILRRQFGAGGPEFLLRKVDLDHGRGYSRCLLKCLSRHSPEGNRYHRMHRLHRTRRKAEERKQNGLLAEWTFGNASQSLHGG